MNKPTFNFHNKLKYTQRTKKIRVANYEKKSEDRAGRLKGRKI